MRPIRLAGWAAAAAAALSWGVVQAGSGQPDPHSEYLQRPIRGMSGAPADAPGSAPARQALTWIRMAQNRHRERSGAGSDAGASERDAQGFGWPEEPESRSTRFGIGYEARMRGRRDSGSGARGGFSAGGGGGARGGGKR
jgi:hypothetical protein